MKRTKPAFAARLGALRAEAGMTAAELGRRAGVPRMTVGRCLHGQQMPSLTILTRLALALAEALGRPVSLDEFREPSES